MVRYLINYSHLVAELLIYVTNVINVCDPFVAKHLYEVDALIVHVRFETCIAWLVNGLWWLSFLHTDLLRLK